MWPMPHDAALPLLKQEGQFSWEEPSDEHHIHERAQFAVYI